MSFVYDTIDDPTDLQAQAQKAVKRDQLSDARVLQARDDFLWLMNEPTGRRIVWQLIQEYDVMGDTFLPNAVANAYIQGKRAFACGILKVVNRHCPHLYSSMIQENRNDRSSADSGRNESNS